MTRVVFWNIERFGIEAIASSSANPDPNAPGKTLAQTAADRRTIILDTLEVANPDILVIVELLGGVNKGTRIAADNGGLSGAVDLLNELRTGTRTNLTSPSWRLVPPYWLMGTTQSSSESVGIFYRGETGTGPGLVNRYFTGPQLWSGGAKGRPVNTGGMEYLRMTRKGADIDINAMLVPPTTTTRVIPPGAQHNEGRDENVVAARFEYTQRGMTTKKNFGVARPPFLATFTEESATGALRDLSVFGVHAPASNTEAPLFIINLADTEEVVAGLGTDETRLVGGDFNVNVLDMAGDESTVYDPLRAEHFVTLLAPAGPPPTDLDPYRGYFATHMDDPIITNDTELQNSKLLWSASSTDLSPYPGYGWFGATLNLFSLDNILVVPHRTSPYDYRTTVLNYVVGTPMNQVVSPPGLPPIGSLALASGITETGWPPAPNAPDFDLAVAQRLIGWDQYGRLRWTSDHFALFAEV